MTIGFSLLALFEVRIHRILVYVKGFLDFSVWMGVTQAPLRLQFPPGAWISTGSDFVRLAGDFWPPPVLPGPLPEMVPGLVPYYMHIIL